MRSSPSALPLSPTPLSSYHGLGGGILRTVLPSSYSPRAQFRKDLVQLETQDNVMDPATAGKIGPPRFLGPFVPPRDSVRAIRERSRYDRGVSLVGRGLRGLIRCVQIPRRRDVRRTRKTFLDTPIKPENRRSKKAKRLPMESAPFFLAGISLQSIVLRCTL